MEQIPEWKGGTLPTTQQIVSIMIKEGFLPQVTCSIEYLLRNSRTPESKNARDVRMVMKRKRDELGGVKNLSYQHLLDAIELFLRREQ